jgi:hypothetical protein
MNPKYTTPPRTERTFGSNALTGAGQSFNPPPSALEVIPPPDTAHPVVEQARRLTDAVRQRAMTTSEDKKNVLSEHVSTLADKLDGIARPSDGSEPGIDDRLIERGTGLLRRFEKVLDENSTKELLTKVEAQIKARPGLFIAGFLALGFMGARLVRK